MNRTLRIALIGGATLLILLAGSYGAGEDTTPPVPGEYGPQSDYGSQGYGPQGGGYASGGYAGDGGYAGGTGYSGGGYVGGSSAQTMREIGDLQMQGWQAQQASSDEMHRQTINGINGTADVYDAQAGETHYGVQSGAGAYWANPTTGSVVGTDVYADNPDASSYNATTNLDDM